MRRILSPVFALAFVACGGLSTTPPAAPEPSSLVQPARNIHLRVSFDDDPSTYLGRFIPDNVPEGEVDESAAVQTRCSQFIKPHMVTSNQEMDEVMYASQKASGSLGVPLVAHVNASDSAFTALRVKYTIAKKMQSEVDTAGLDRCCKDQPDQCSKRYIAEFLMGTGRVFQNAGSDSRAAAAGQWKDVTGEIEVKDSVAWKKVSSFKDMYFAFQPGSGMGQLALAPPAGGDDCGFCEALPSSLDGKYFCGVSPDAPSESMARDYAMRNAREQVIKYMGEYLSTRSKTTASLVRGYLEDTQLLSAGAEGLASRVKDQRWCRAQVVNMPDGARYRSRVLAYLANDQLEGAARDAIETLIVKRRAAHAITDDQELHLRALVK